MALLLAPLPGPDDPGPELPGPLLSGPDDGPLDGPLLSGPDDGPLDGPLLSGPDDGPLGSELALGDESDGDELGVLEEEPLLLDGPELEGELLEPAPRLSDRITP